MRSQRNFEELSNCKLRTRRTIKKNYKKDFVLDYLRVKNNEI